MKNFPNLQDVKKQDEVLLEGGKIFVSLTVDKHFSSSVEASYDGN